MNRRAYHLKQYFDDARNDNLAAFVAQSADLDASRAGQQAPLASNTVLRHRLEQYTGYTNRPPGLSVAFPRTRLPTQLFTNSCMSAYACCSFCCFAEHMTSHIAEFNEPYPVEHFRLPLSMAMMQPRSILAGAHQVRVPINNYLSHGRCSHQSESALFIANLLVTLPMSSSRNE